MRLVALRVQNYKIIDDTERVPVDPAVTALVGKNESGKTAILRALWKSKNVANAKFDKLYDYPRDRYSRERKGRQQVVEMEFSLEAAEVQQILTLLPPSPPFDVRTVTYTVWYDGEDKSLIHASFGERQAAFDEAQRRRASEVTDAIDAVLQSIQGLGGDSAVVGESSIWSAKLTTAKFIWEPACLEVLTTFQQKVQTWIAADSARHPVGEQACQRLDALLAAAKRGDPMTPVEEWVLKNVPTFIYFDDYGQLETRINLPFYLGHQNSPDDKTRTQQALFEWSGLDAQEILDLGKPKANGESDDLINRRKEKRRALLDSASFGLTGDWSKWWDGKQHKLHFDVDGDDLVLKVSDEHNEFPLPFEERSQGFQWFFSFYLVFLVESKRAHKGAILLLDEPGLHLHPTLQTKLIAFFERIAEGNQLLYSTHLPFLIDGNNLHRVRTVYLHGPDPQKTRVSTDMRPSGDKDTLLPLQAAVSYSIAQTLFLGKRTLIVEGITDYWLIKALDTHLQQSRKDDSLHPDTVLLFAGGTSRLMPLASIMLGTLGIEENKLLILLDSDKAGQSAARQITEVFHDEATVLLLGTAIGRPRATIEDMIPRETYAAALRAAGHEVTLTRDETEMETTVATMERAFARLGLGAFGAEHKSAALLQLIGQWSKTPDAIPTSTLASARQLIKTVNAAFSS